MRVRLPLATVVHHLRINQFVHSLGRVRRKTTQESTFYRDNPPPKMPPKNFRSGQLRAVVFAKSCLVFLGWLRDGYPAAGRF